MYRWNETFTNFGGTKFRKGQVQTNKYNIYIYIHIFTHVSHQESYTGRTARNMTSPEKKTYTCVIPEKDTLYMHKAKEWIILRAPDFPKNSRSIIIHPYTLHILGFFDKSFFSSYLLLSPSFCLFNKKCGPLSRNSWNQMVATGHNLFC